MRYLVYQKDPGELLGKGFLVRTFRTEKKAQEWIDKKEKAVHYEVKTGKEYHLNFNLVSVGG